ncbi:helix-turn-helix domain-containing protein [Halobacterium yunchengense]|uniref:helix-turn-helix domain-containing protein n=1 Tax=Halobacterium yunchengense TaxID=3108497 RepID=UPI00300A7FE2
MQVNEPADRRVDAPDAATLLRGPFETATDADPGDVLDALSDPLCRRVLGCATDPVTAREVASATDCSTSTTYRKLETLTDAGLLETQTEIREDGYHTTRYRTSLSEATIHVGGDGDGVDVTLRRRAED